MTSRVFTVAELEDLEVSWANEYQEGMGARRWSETFRTVFEFDGKFYEVYVEKGLTEYQETYGAERYPDATVDDGEWIVDCPEVERYAETVVVEKWRKL